MTTATLWQITAPHFVAGLITDGRPIPKVVLAAPIIKWSTGRSLCSVKQYCLRKSWTLSHVEPSPDPQATRGDIHIQVLPEIDSSYLIRHKTYITIANHPQYESRLLNQYDLAEVNSAKAGVSEPIPAAFRQSSYRRWLWDNMQDDRNVIWRELSLLAHACAAGLDITITVHAGAVHAAIIANAVRWMMAHTDRPVHSHRPRRRQYPSSFPLDDDFPPNIAWNRIVWITGSTCSKLAYLYETDAVITALVPGHEELIKTGRWHWTPNVKHWQECPHYMRKCWWKLDGVTDYLADAITKFNEDQKTYPAYEKRYDPWRHDALTPDTPNRQLNDEYIKRKEVRPKPVPQAFHQPDYKPRMVQKAA